MSPIAVTKAPAVRSTTPVVEPSVLNRILPFATVCLLSSCLLFAELGKYPLFNPDEALYAEPAREMLENGDFITTYLNYVIRFTKPPLVIWAQSLGITLFGVNEFAVRFFEAACGLGLVAATYIFTERLVNRRAAVVAAVTLTTAPLFIGTAREAITDMPLSLFIAGAMMCFFLGRKEGKTRPLWLGWMLTGLSVMTKGPVGLVLPVGILLACALLQGRMRTILQDYKVLPGLAIVGLIALPWFIAEITITRGAYFHEFILRENFQRFTSAIDSHGQPWWYHIAAMFGGFAPWSLFLPAAFAAVLPELVQALRNLFAPLTRMAALGARPSNAPQNNSTDKKASDCSNSRNPNAFASSSSLLPSGTAENVEGVEPSLALYCTMWSLGTLIFFSASVSKLLPYTMPAYPALAVLVAIEFERIIQFRDNRRALIPVCLIAGLFACASGLLPLALAKLRDAPPELIGLLRSFVTYQLVFALITVALTARRLYKAAWFAFCVPTVLGLLFFGGKLLNTISDTWEGPLPAMAQYAAVSDTPVYVFDMRKPSVPFYTRRRVLQPSSQAELLSQLEQNSRAYILTKSKTRKFIESIAGCKVIRQEGSFLLAAYRRPSG